MPTRSGYPQGGGVSPTNWTPEAYAAPAAYQQPPEEPQYVPPGPPAQPPQDYQAYARWIAQQYGIDPNIFYRQINQESRFNSAARGSSGEVGIAQIMPKFHPGVDPSDPYASMDYAAKLMKQYYDQYQNWATALAAYNAGPGAVAQYGGVPPYETTQQYIQAILGGGG